MGRDGKPVPYEKKRYRAAQGKNDYTYFAHDLAVGPADKFQFGEAVKFKRLSMKYL